MKRKAITFFLLAILLFPVSAWAGLTKTQVSQLYVSIFGRASEGEGNAFWQTQPDMATAAAAMLDTQAAKDYFGANLNTNQAFIEHIYLNTLNKTIADDFDGINYWINMLDAGTSRGQAVATLVGAINDYAPDGPYYDPNDAATLAAYNQFMNRVEVSNYMADNVYATPDDWETSTSFSHGIVVTDDPATAYAAMVVVNGFLVTVKGPAYELIPAVITPGSGQPVRINYYGYPDTMVVEIERRDGTLIPLLNVPNTNKWTINLPETEVLEDYNPLNLLNFIGILKTVDGTGPSDYVQLFAPILGQNMISVSPVKLSENVQASPHVVNIRYDGLYSDENSISNINEIFYQHFDDDYDFIVENWLARDANRYQHYVGIRNDIQGTGVPIYDSTEAYGADGTQRLKGLVYFSPNGSIDLAAQVVCHEIGHALMNFLKDTPLSTNTAHFPVSTTAFGIMGLSSPRTDIKLTMFPNGDYRVDSQIPFGGFNEFELYMMGLIPSSEVPDQIVFDDQTAPLIPGTILAGPGTTVTIDQVIAANGPRIPAYPLAQTEFNVATIVISRGRLLSLDEMTYLDYMAARGEATVPLDDYTKRSFYVSTGGRGSLSTSIHFPNQ